MINYLKLKTKYLINSEEIEEAEKLGLECESKYSIDILYVNPNKISSFNESKEGNTTIGLDGERWLIEMNFKKFRDLILSYE